MVDLSDKGLGSDEMSSETTSPETSQSNVKTCVDCGTTKTPLWRGGPAGPKGLGSEEMSSETTSPETSQSNVKTCVDCGTTKTPLWRGGPAGPKSLCNACGIKSSKNRRGLLGLKKEDKKLKKSVPFGNKSCNSSSSSSSGDSRSSNFVKNIVSSSLKKKLLPFGKEEKVLQKPRSSSTQKRKLGEVEQAAFLLMALSCGSFYAQRKMKMEKERKGENCCTFDSKSSTLCVG